MSNKPEQYWSEIQRMAEEVSRLSIEVQGPLIDEHIEFIDTTEMDVTEITDYIAQFYDDETRLAWASLEVRGQRIAEEFNVNTDEISTDLWSQVAGLAEVNSSTTRH